jgi:hypothetical protein
MKPRRLRQAIALFALLIPAIPLLGQQDTAATDRPFVRGGVYDKPFLTRLGSNTAIGGYAEAHARWEEVGGLREEAGFEAKRFNLFTATQVSDFVRIGAEIEIEEGGEEVKLEYAAIDLRIHPALTLRGGMILSPLGRFNLSHDAPLNEFTDRPLVSTELLGVALSEPGFGVLGQMGFGRTGRVTLEGYATNGFHDGLITASEEGTRIPLGRGNTEDANASPALVGRVTVSPRVGWEFGVSAHHGAWNIWNVEGAAIGERRNLTIGVVDMDMRFGALTLQGEVATASIDVPPGLVGIYASRQRGGYLDLSMPFGAGWIAAMPASHFTAKLRFDAVDLDVDRTGQSTQQVSVGVNFRPTADTALKFDLVRGRASDEFNVRAEHARLLMSLATYF